MLTQLLAFAGVSALVICTPGPDTALTVRNALTGGRRCGVWTGAGVGIGQAAWTVAASVGIAGLLRASQPAFLAMKVAGAAYLFCLGIQALLAARRGDGHEGGRTASLPLTPVRALRQGVLNDLANPKMAAFFLSLLPQFVPAGPGMVPESLAFGLLFALLTFSWLAAYSLAVDRARRILVRSRIKRVLDALAGCVFIGFGARLAASRAT